MPLLEIRNLAVDFATARGRFRAVDGVDVTVDEGEVLCIVGESGSGKSVSMLAAMGLIGWPGRVSAEALRFDGADLLSLSARQRRRVVGKDMAMVFQEPMSSLNPCYPVGWQIAEALRAHDAVPRNKVRDRVVELLDQVGIPDPGRRLSAFPHQLSGGMNQRVMIAMAIACNPRLLIADEPTTALDVTIQKQILDLLVDLQKQRGMALVLITHDMGVVAETAHRVQVMYAGQMVEEQPTEALFATPRHPYTAALLDALPERALGRRRLPTIPGVVPGIDDRPQGCLFNPRCRFADTACRSVPPTLAGPSGRRARCHFPLDRTPSAAPPPGVADGEGPSQVLQP
ncbi:dipeptide ABC transporter ATP binding subunit DppD [Rhodovastum atsumiense]|uniref:ABC transporter ATP-binding protein n=1 Tax=Rhodovastum atsumiense TaxID=504468 RepID=A0A5M6ITA8_9PROT|nr:ABC transporter ATP-binding protein [Rhodovastum atsumiense]KAA5611067.1 ABC transporter ATP-binding protein [Rhodovastum atsumiense]CAH2599125.1 dipeptide ABC transporter ATP binding subunit DppD [Rhodovastum atsumiense]